MNRTSWLLAVFIVIAIIATNFAVSRDAIAQGIGLSFVGPVSVIIESSGNLAVLDKNGDAVFRVLPNRGDRTIVSNGNNGMGPNYSNPIDSNPIDIAAERFRTFVVVDANYDAMFRVDSMTGDRTVISGCPRTRNPCPVPLVGTGPAFGRPVSVAVETRGTLVVVDFDAKAVLRVDPVTGNRTILSNVDRGTGPLLDEPMGIAVQANGSLALADFALDAVVEVDVVTGDRRILSGCAEVPDPCPVSLVGSGPSFLRPVDVAIRPNRNLVVIDVDLRAVFEVNPNNGNRRILSSAGVGAGPVFLNPMGIVADRNRRLFVADEARRAVIQVDPISGERRISSQAPDLIISPPSGTYTALQSFDLVLIVEGAIDEVSILSAVVHATDDVTSDLTSCSVEQQLTGTGIALRCANADTVLGLDPGRYRFDVRVNANLRGVGNIQLRDRVFWNIIGEVENLR